MNLSQLFLILRARKKIVFFTLIFTVVCTLAVSLMLPKTYKATSSLLLRFTRE